MTDSGVPAAANGAGTTGSRQGLTVPHTDPSIDFSKVERMLRDDLASANLGMEVTELALGTATVTMPVTRHMCQGHGTCHGGYIMTVADSAFAAACNSHGPVTVAAAVQIHYLAPAHDGDVLTARAREVSRWGRNGIYDVEVTNDKGVVVAQFRGTSRSIERS